MEENTDILFPKKLCWTFDNRPLHLWTPLLFACSPNDWAEHVHVTGYLFLKEKSYRPLDELSAFLDSGDVPVCISFDSMVNRKAERIDQVVREALKQMNNRGIIFSGWGSVKSRSSKDLLYLESASHDWLLLRCKMVIHHSGAGTTSAGLHAGIPNIVVLKPILVDKLSVENLTQAIVEADSNSIRKCASSLVKT